MSKTKEEDNDGFFCCLTILEWNSPANLENELHLCQVKISRFKKKTGMHLENTELHLENPESCLKKQYWQLDLTGNLP